jgi:imidazolonepropionase-like amidohydrolase/Tol biopolymer transport system component
MKRSFPRFPLLLTCSLAATTLVLGGFSAAQEEDAEGSWDVASPPMQTREITIDVTEGTWMNVDVSPDGETIAFDLLGDIYTMPIGGGSPTRITEGLPFDMQPRWSPDGGRIAFTSDRSGGDNIWTMNADGEDLRQITDEDFRLLNSPTWHPTEPYIVAKKHFTTQRSLGTGELWLYHLAGGAGTAIVERPNEDIQKELGEPVFSPDGKTVYFTRNVSPGNTFIYAQDSNQSLFEIEALDLQTGERRTVVEGAGGAVRPAPSPDGRMIAFVRRDRNVSRLYVKNFEDGSIREIYGPLDRDMQETWAVHGVYPQIDWTPDSEAVVFWAKGKLWRAPLDGEAVEIPFEIKDTRAVIEAPRPSVDVAPETFRTSVARHLAVSPDGQIHVFAALGKLYVKSGNGEPERLTNTGEGIREVFPSFSRDGRRIVFVSWTDDDLGAIMTVSARGGRPRKVTEQNGHYRRPAFSPDGDTIVFEQGSGGYLLSDLRSDDSGIYRIGTDGRNMERVAASGSDPHFGASNERVYFNKSGENAMLVSTTLDGYDETVHFESALGYDFEVAPDGRHIAFFENYDVYVTPMPLLAQGLSVGRDTSAYPVVNASGVGADSFAWADEGATLHWTLGAEGYAADVADILPGRPASEDEEGYEPPEAQIDLSIAADADIPEGMVALTGARIVTMAEDDGGVIENGTILIEGNRIVAIGEDVDVPDDAETMDLEGRTIIPGLIDAHAHGPYSDASIIPQTNWSTVAHLALGVTTTFDPSSNADSFAAAALQRTGDILAPRLYTTGRIVYGAKSPTAYADIQSYEDALAHVRRLKKQGAHGIKNYNQPRRDQRQMVVKAAKEEDILVVAEGGSLFTMDMTLIADGNSALEHNLPQETLYEDVLSFYGQTNVAYTPTLVVTYGGLAGDPYWRYATDVWTHPILSQHVPRHILEPSSVRRTKAPEEDFADKYAAREARKLADRGVMVSIGAHGQQQGLAAHWEMWSFARGGMSPLEALRTATTTPARHLGFDADIGSLEEGKLADLVILSKNPLEDIQNSDDITHVMQNGRLYDAKTMEEVLTGDRSAPDYYWKEGSR